MFKQVIYFGVIRYVYFLVGDITQKGYEKKRRKLLLPFMTGPNQPNSHPCEQTSPLASEAQVNKNKELNPLEETPQSPNSLEQNEVLAATPTISNIPSEAEEINPTTILISSDTSLLDSSSQPPTPSEHQVKSPQLSNNPQISDGGGNDISVCTNQLSKLEDTHSTAPAVPPHKNSSDQCEETVSHESANIIAPETNKDASAAIIAQQPGSSIEIGGAAHKSKGGKPRSRNRHKR